MFQGFRSIAANTMPTVKQAIESNVPTPWVTAFAISSDTVCGLFVADAADWEEESISDRFVGYLINVIT